jgi:hypothetical protein
MDAARAERLTPPAVVAFGRNRHSRRKRARTTTPCRSGSVDARSGGWTRAGRRRRRGRPRTKVDCDGCGRSDSSRTSRRTSTMRTITRGEVGARRADRRSPRQTAITASTLLVTSTSGGAAVAQGSATAPSAAGGLDQIISICSPACVSRSVSARFSHSRGLCARLRRPAL